MICYDDACSRKREAPSPAPGPVECAEIVVKFVLLETQLIRNAEGSPYSQRQHSQTMNFNAGIFELYRQRTEQLGQGQAPSP